MTLVGRTDERRRIRELLGDRSRAPAVIHLQGMPGIGKSALLDQLAVDAGELGYAVASAPLDRAPADRAQALYERIAPVDRPTLLVADQWHELGLWEPALIERVERASGPLVLLIGSRLRPGDALLDSGLVPGRLFVIELGPIDPEDGVGMLAERGIGRDDALRLHASTGGQPFAMLLLSGSPSLWSARLDLDEQVSDALIRRLVGRIAEPEVREALDLLALVGVLNESELRTVFGWSLPDARRTFDQLRQLTLVRPSEAPAARGARGLQLHPIVRASVLAELHLRDPGRARALATAAMAPIDEALKWSGLPRDRALGQLRDLIAAAPQDEAMSGMFQLAATSGVATGVAAARERDLEEALALIGALEGEGARAIAARWAAYDPSSVTVIRAGDRIDAAMIRPEFRGPVVPPALSEPAIDRVTAALAADGQLQPGVLLRTTRFFLARDHHQMPCAPLAALGAAITARTLETNEPFFSVQHLDARAVDAWRDIIATFGIAIRQDAAAVVDGRVIVPCVGDATDQGRLFSGVARRAWGIDAPPVQGPATVPSDLEDEVVEALRHMRDEVWLRTSPLGVHLFGSAPPDERARQLKDWLEAEVDATQNMRHGDLVSRALRATFGGDRSAEEAAAAAGMAPTTLKRYRRIGVRHIAAVARQRSDADRSDADRSDATR